MINRKLQQQIEESLQKFPVVGLIGARQVGKTTLAKALLRPEPDLYYNWDRREDRKAILAARWPAIESTVVLDELHKYGHWKRWIKGE